MAEEFITEEEMQELLGFDSEQEWLDEVARQQGELSSAPPLPETGQHGDGTGIAHPQSPDDDNPVDCDQAINNINTIRTWIQGAKNTIAALDEYVHNATLNNLRTDAQRYVNRYDHLENVTTDFDDIFNIINDDFATARFRGDLLNEAWFSETELLRAWEAHYDHYCKDATSPISQ